MFQILYIMLSLDAKGQCHDMFHTLSPRARNGTIPSVLPASTQIWRGDMQLSSISLTLASADAQRISFSPIRFRFNLCVLFPVRMITKEMHGKTEKQLFIYRKYVSLSPPGHLPHSGVIPLGNTGISIYTFLIWLS